MADADDVLALPPILEESSPTAKLVYLALGDAAGPLTTREIAAWIEADVHYSQYPPRSGGRCDDIGVFDHSTGMISQYPPRSDGRCDRGGYPA